MPRLADHLTFCVNAGSISCLRPYSSTIAEIAQIDIEIAYGTQVHTRARWVEEGETCSAFFLRLKKKRAADRLLQPCVWMTDPLYRILMTCTVFFRPFTRPCLLVKLPLLLYQIFVGQCLLYYASNSGRPLDPDECFVAWILHMNLLRELLKTTFRSMAGFIPSGGSKSKVILLFVIVVAT